MLRWPAGLFYGAVCRSYRGAPARTPRRWSLALASSVMQARSGVCSDQHILDQFGGPGLGSLASPLFHFIDSLIQGCASHTRRLERPRLECRAWRAYSCFCRCPMLVAHAGGGTSHAVAWSPLLLLLLRAAAAAARSVQCQADIHVITQAGCAEPSLRLESEPGPESELERD